MTDPFIRELRAAVDIKRSRQGGAKTRRNYKAAALAPQMPVTAALADSAGAFGRRLAKAIEKEVFSQLPFLGSGDPLDLVALEAGLASVEAQVATLAEKVRPQALKGAVRADKQARAEALRLLKVDLPVGGPDGGDFVAERLVQSLKATGAAQIMRIRRAIREYEEGTSMRQAILDTLWVSRVRSRMAAAGEANRYFRDRFASYASLSGSSEGVYVTSRDDRVRDSHAANEGKRFRWDNPPSTLSEPNCRCVLVPVEALT